MLYTNAQTIEIKPCSRVNIESDRDFTVYGLVDGEKVSVHPSINRRLSLFPAEQVDAILVDIEDGGLFICQISEIPNPKEKPDLRPVEIPLGLDRPPSLKEEMQMYIRQQFSQLAEEHNLGSFEEEDDFDIDDDDLPYSKYEQTEEMMNMKPEENLVDYSVDEPTGSKDEPETDPQSPPLETPEEPQVASR
jgi:hypothetical protein